MKKKYLGLGICLLISIASIVIEKEYFGFLEWLIEKDYYFPLLWSLALIQLVVTLWIILIPPRKLLLSITVAILLVVGQTAVIDNIATYVLMRNAASRGTFAP